MIHENIIKLIDEGAKAPLKSACRYPKRVLPGRVEINISSVKSKEFLVHLWQEEEGKEAQN